MRGATAAALGFLFIVGAALPAKAGAFVYVGSCSSTACGSSEVRVYDQTTAALVTRIVVPGVRQISGMVLSRDGLRLYVAGPTTTGGTVAVIDATSHTLSAMFAIPTLVTGALALSRDGTRLFVGSVLPLVYDTRSFSQIGTLSNPLGGVVQGMAASPQQDRLYVLYLTALGAPLTPGAGIVEYNSATGAMTARSPVTSTTAKWRGIRVTDDGTQLIATGDTVSFVDLQSFQVARTLTPVPAGASRSLDLPSWHQLLTLSPAPTSTIYVTSTDTLAPIADIGIAAPAMMAASADASRVWVTTEKSNEGGVDALNVLNPATDTLTQSIPLPGTTFAIAATPANAKPCTYSLNTSQSPWPTSGGSTTIALSTPCTWVTSSDQSWAHTDLTSGTGGATITLTVDANSTAATRRASVSIGGQIVNVVQAGFTSQPPFGTVDTPADNVTGVSGSLNVTGWALDDVGVTRVRIYRDAVAGEPAGLVYIGDGTFVDGARPDVAAAYAFEPNATRAGWGLQVLTNMLPGQGNGTYRLTVFADDVDGHTALIGTRTFTSDNATAIVPFGTIDTPGSGESLSGTIVNFGWALTPNPAMIPFDGSTIDVLIDGIAVGHPTYGLARADIDATFPGYANTGRAVGYFIIDTTQLSNGLHTLSWIVHDSQGGSQGIGSRFFMVSN